MKRLHDYICWECKIMGEAYLEMGDFPLCPKCNKPMEIHYTQLHYDTFFPGSHNAEYTAHGRKFNGCTKQQLLEGVSFSKRVGGRILKKGLKGQVLDDKKHEKKIE